LNQSLAWRLIDSNCWLRDRGCVRLCACEWLLPFQFLMEVTGCIEAPHIPACTPER
jgi:hypothetical protein